MGPKKKKATTPKKGKPRKSNTVAIAPPPDAEKQKPTSAPAPAPAPPPKPKCPWSHLRSPYGGKMSPADEWTKLTGADYSASVVEINKEILKEEGVGVDQVIQYAVNIYEAPPTEPEPVITPEPEPEPVLTPEPEPAPEPTLLDGSDAAPPVQGDATPTPTPTPSPAPAPKTIDTLQIINCELKTLPIPPNILQKLISLHVPGSCLSSNTITTLLSSSPSFLRCLSLVGNALTSIPLQLFSHTPKLLELDLSYNKGLGACFPTDAFSSTPSLSMTLRSLNLEACNISAGLVDSLASLNNLRILNISANEISMEELTKLAPEVSPPPQFVGKLEKFNFHPMNSVANDKAYPTTFSKLLKKMICLKSLDENPFSQSMKIDVEQLAKLDMTADDENTKDSSTCSCVYGNPCTSKYNCKPHIWFRRYEVAKQAKEDPDFDVAKALAGGG